MTRWEVLLAKGRTIKEFEREINRIANIRNVEIEAALDKGFDVMDLSEYHFSPQSPVNYHDGQYTQVWMRQAGFVA